MSVKLVKDLDFATVISEAHAATSAGQDFLNVYKSYLFNNPANCSLVNSFVNEASNYSYDTGLTAIVDSVKNFINENNISWQLASACEQINANNSSYGYIAKIGVNTVEKLLEMKESDVVAYIKAGALKSVQYIPEFRNVCKQVYNQQVEEVAHVNYNVTSPIGYVLIDENNNTYLRINNRDFKISEGNVELVSNVTDSTYNEINSLLESFTRDGENIYYEYTTPRQENIRFTIENSSETPTLNFKKNDKVNETFDSAIKFVEYANIISKTMPVNEKLDFMAKSNAIAKVFEHINNVVVIDCAKYITTNNGFSGAIVEADNNVNLTIFHSVHSGSSTTNYNYIVEALKAVTRETGIDLSTMYSERINEDCKKTPSDESNEIREQLEANKAAQYKIRKQKIAALAESYKHDPVKIALLNNIAKDLNMLEK